MSILDVHAADDRCSVSGYFACSERNPWQFESMHRTKHYTCAVESLVVGELTVEPLGVGEAKL